MSIATRTTFALLPSLLAFISTLGAQEGTWTWRPVPLPPALANLLTSQMVAGNFTGHDYPDLAFLAGTEVGLLTAPAVHNAIDGIVLGMNATGLGKLRGAGANGTDALLVATPGGVYQWQLGAQLPLPLIAAGQWHSLAVGNLGSASELCLVGIGNASRNQVRVHRLGQTLQPVPIEFPGETIAAVQLAQWDGVGGLEICVATDQGFWVGTYAAETLFALPLPNLGSSHLVRVEMPNRDSLAWLATPVADGLQRLMTLSSLGQSCVASSPLGAVRELSSGLYDRDLRGDLLVAQVGSNSLQLLKNVEGTTGVLPGVAQFTSVPEGITPWGLQLVDATLSCSMIVDLNADRRSDLVTLQASSNCAWIRRWIPPYDYNTNRPVLGAWFQSEQLDANTLQVTIPIAVANRPASATHLDVLLFGAVAGTTSALILQPIGLQHPRMAGNPGSFTLTQPLAANSWRAMVGMARWTRVENGVTTNVWAPTRFALAYDGMRLVLDSWYSARIQQVPLDPNLWTPGVPGSNYFWRELDPVAVPPLYGPTRGFEEPPDLPPKPPEPPTPPSPPPPDTNVGG